MNPISKWIFLAVLTVLLTVQGGDERAHADEDGVAANAAIVLKIATVAPRIPEIARRSKALNEELAALTNGRIQFRTYWGGVAGDDTTVVRKMRAAQIDGTAVTMDIISSYVKQATVMIAPQTFFNYKQVDAVRAEIGPEFEKEAYDNQIKILNWWDGGRLRIFSQNPVYEFEDLQRGRPWLYPSSMLLKEFYKMQKITGIPLDISEVYGGLQTGMIDAVWVSSVLSSVLRWSSHTNYVSPPVGVIQGAVILRRPAWDAMSESEREAVQRVSDKQLVETLRDFRQGDETAYKKLLKRGMVATQWKDSARWLNAGKVLRDKMVGRTYSKEMLQRVEAITKRYADAS